MVFAIDVRHQLLSAGRIGDFRELILHGDAVAIGRTLPRADRVGGLRAAGPGEVQGIRARQRRAEPRMRTGMGQSLGKRRQVTRLITWRARIGHVLRQQFLPSSHPRQSLFRKTKQANIRRASLGRVHHISLFAYG